MQPTATESSRNHPDAQALAVGVFEDALDVCEAAGQLAKSGYGPERLAVLARDQDADQGDQSERTGTVAQALLSTGLKSVATQIAGLTLAVLPERGTFLLGGALAQVLLSAGEQPADTAPYDGMLEQLLATAGFSAHEADFLTGRLASGAVLLGVRGAEGDDLQAARERLANHNAIHIGLSRPVTLASTPLGTLTAMPGSRLPGDIVVNDLVGPFIAVCGAPDAAEAWSKRCEAAVADDHGDVVGTLAELFIGPHEDSQALRYAVIKHGGVLGMLQRQTVVPAELLTFAEDGSARVDTGYDILDNAPAFDPDLPLSRHEEGVICAYFGVAPYWAVADEAPTASREEDGV